MYRWLFERWICSLCPFSVIFLSFFVSSFHRLYSFLRGNVNGKIEYDWISKRHKIKIIFEWKTQTFHTKSYNMPRLFLMFEGIEYDFWLLRAWIPGAASGNCLVTNGLREVWLLCCFDVRWTRLPVLASGGDSGISKGTFALAGVYAASFAALCTTA